MLHVSLFKHPRDVNVNNNITFTSFHVFTNWLEQLSKLVFVKPSRDEFFSKHHAPLISPAIYKENSSRKNESVLKWSKWAALDIDDMIGEFKPDSFDNKGISCVVYSTASSTKEMSKFRLIVELNEEIEKEDIPAFWYALNELYGRIGDKQVKDMSRMYYIPAAYPNAHHFFYRFDGKPIQPKELIAQYPMPTLKQRLVDMLPSSYLTELKNRRMDNLTRNVFWTNYKDCPFVNQQQVVEYKLLQNTGWYKKLYDIMVSISFRAIEYGYNITVDEIEQLIREIDMDTGGWYEKRPIRIEAERALKYAFQKAMTTGENNNEW